MYFGPGQYRPQEPKSPRVPSLLFPDWSSCSLPEGCSYPHRLAFSRGPLLALPYPWFPACNSCFSAPSLGRVGAGLGSVHILCLHWLPSPPLHLPHPHSPQPQLWKLHFRFSMLQPRVSPQGPAQPGHQLIKDLQQDVGITVKPGSGSTGQRAKSCL